MTMPSPSVEPQSGRCAKCRENTVLERVPCEDCKGTGNAVSESDFLGSFLPSVACPFCDRDGYIVSSPCCGWPVLDEAGAVDAANDRAQEG